MAGKRNIISGWLQETGDLSAFAWRYVRDSFRPPYDFAELLRQSFEVGYRSLALVGITAFIMGLVITIQSRPTLVEFGAESWLPAMVSVSLVREIVPVVTALICAGRIGSGIGAELGSMKVTEQIDAMEVSGTNPFKYLVVSRITATTLMLPVLVSIAGAISLWGAYIGCNIKGVVSFDLYVRQVFDTLEYGDVLPAIIKSVFFGFAIGLIGSFKGYTTSKGTEGVGMAANSAVVISSLVVFIIDLLAAQITDLLNMN